MSQGVKNSEDKQLLRVLKRGLRELHPEDLAPRSPCPDSGTLASYVVDELDVSTRQAVNVHMALCDRCLEDYVALAGPEKITEILSQEIREGKFNETVSKKIPEKSSFTTLEKLKGGWFNVVHFGQTVGQAASEVLKVGQNSYSFGVSMSEGQVMCKVAGLRTPVRVPLLISVRSETGTEVISTHTDDSGNAQFVLPGARGERRVVSIEVPGQKLHRQFTIDENLKLH